MGKGSCGDEVRNSVDTEYGVRKREREKDGGRGNGGAGDAKTPAQRFLAHAIVSQACPAFPFPTANRCGLRLYGHSADASAPLAAISGARP